MITKNEISSLNLSPTKKDFVQIWNELIEVASKITERWDPTSTNESDPGIVLLKVLAGIADKLNYNIDKNILEAYMPTAAQMESMRKLCELVGYDIKYYQSAETTVRISYTGNTADEEERLKGFGLPIPKFTTITNVDKDITFITTNDIPMYITNSNPWVEVPCIEGQISQCESVNENNLITLAQLDDNMRYYLPETQIAENGIFVYNAVVTATADNNSVVSEGTAWESVSNLNILPSDTRVFKFGYDSFEGRPYIAFPEDAGGLIGEGLLIYFVRTSGLNGNISPRVLETLEIPSHEAWAEYSAEQFEVVNVNAATNGSNIESISAAYNNFKKTIGTFDTLVTCRDYMNKIYSLMDASNLPYVSNILVTDIRNDINNAITLCSYNEYGILYKETALPKSATDDSAAIDHFDLLLYPFKTFAQVSAGTLDLVAPYNSSFTYTEQTNREIEASLADLKTCAHNFKTPLEGDIVAINNYLRLDALIATSVRVSEAEAKDILKNVKVALVNEFNLRNLDFGEEIPFDSILSVIENADTRIKVVSLREPTLLTTYSIKESANSSNYFTATSKEYGIASTDSDDRIRGVIYEDDKYDWDDNDTLVYTKAKAKECYNKLALRNILAGRAALFDYDETFIASNSEKPYTITKEIKTKLETELKSETNAQYALAQKISAAIQALLESEDLQVGEYILYEADMPINGFNNGVLTLKVFEKVINNLDNAGSNMRSTDEQVSEWYDYLLYETYEYDFIKAAKNQNEPATTEPQSTTPAMFRLTRNTPSETNNSSIIKDIAQVEALCEIESSTNTFNNITLAKNEVIKFRAPNLITTQTFPAYVYYNYKKANKGTASESTSGHYAKAMQLSSFINAINEGQPQEKFFTEFWNSSAIVANVKYIKASTEYGGTPVINQSNQLSDIFKTAIAVGTDITASGYATRTLVFTGDSELRTYLNCFVGTDDEKQTQITEYLARYFASSADFTAYANKLKGLTTINFKYYPLNVGTMNNWSKYARSCYYNKTKKQLPGNTTLWRLSSTSNYPQGRLITESGQKLYAQSGDYLANNNVAEVTYICTDLGADPKHYTLPENGDIELQAGDKLYIHYTPSSTNENGETVNAEPISIVYEGGDIENPLILKPSGFELIPSEDVVNLQGVSWKKTDVDFNGEKVNLLALAPNEQIELRSISKVVLNTPAMFYKNFDNVGLENGSLTEYELKDGEYIFYTDQNTQDAAYYGSGSVISLKGGAYIPKTAQIKEVSQILEQGLHIVPWSNIVLLNDARTITVTEYQYVTLVEGDTINTLIIDGDNSDSYKLNKTWKECISATYTPAGAESSSSLPAMELESSTGWEACSILELSTSPGHAQTLRAEASAAPTDLVIEDETEGSVYISTDGRLSVVVNEEAKTIILTDAFNAQDTLFTYEIAEDQSIILYNSMGEEVSAEDISISISDEGILTEIKYNGELYALNSSGESGQIPVKSATTITDKIKLRLNTDTDWTAPIEISPQETVVPGTDNLTVFEPLSIKLDRIVQTASGSFTPVAAETEESTGAPTVQMKVFKELPPEVLELSSADEVITPISVKDSAPLEYSAVNINNYWTKLDVSVTLFNSINNGTTEEEANKKPRAVSLNFMVPEDLDLFGVFSIYLNTSAGIDADTNIPQAGRRVFIDVPSELGAFNNAITLFNYRDSDGEYADWWQGGVDTEHPNRLYLRAGLNCIKVLKSCSLFIKAESSAIGNILYDNLRLVRGRATNGVNLNLIDFDAASIAGTEKSRETLADELLEQLATLDKNHEFYYNVPVENSLAMEFDNNISSLSNPYTLYDINNINNNFVVSKLDIDYLDTGLRIAKSSKY